MNSCMLIIFILFRDQVFFQNYLPFIKGQKYFLNQVHHCYLHTKCSSLAVTQQYWRADSCVPNEWQQSWSTQQTPCQPCLMWWYRLQRWWKSQTTSAQSLTVSSSVENLHFHWTRWCLRHWVTRENLYRAIPWHV